MGLDITGARLHAQRLSVPGFARPEDVVRWFGAVQAQEYGDAKWSLGLRMRQANDAAIERAFANGRILRTHVLRPTWHFVTPADIRWMLALTGPRVSAALASYNRRLELDTGVFRRSQRAFAKALRNGAQLTRQELKAVLHRSGVDPGGVQRLAHIVMQAELDAVICSGARRGKQFTYALLDERVPSAPALSRDVAVAELTRRYFTSHGPAQAQDFAWWSGLTAADARTGLEIVASQLTQERVNGRTYWFSPRLVRRSSSSTAYLLPLYDEYLIAYKDRSAALDLARWKSLVQHDAFIAPIVVDGHVLGGWRRRHQTNGVRIRITPFAPLDTTSRRAIAGSLRAYADFMGLDVVPFSMSPWSPSFEMDLSVRVARSGA
jgi:Winged helix DNA-binding domain